MICEMRYLMNLISLHNQVTVLIAYLNNMCLPAYRYLKNMICLAHVDIAQIDCTFQTKYCNLVHLCHFVLKHCIFCFIYIGDSYTFLYTRFHFAFHKLNL